MKTSLLTKNSVTIEWQRVDKAEHYNVYWQDACHIQARFKNIAQTSNTSFTLNKATNVPHYFYVAAVVNGLEQSPSAILQTPITQHPSPQLEKLGRGLIGVCTTEGVFLSWRLLITEVWGFNEDAKGLVGVDFDVFKNGKQIATIENSTNYIDKTGTPEDIYSVAPINGDKCDEISPWINGYYDVPLKKPQGGVTPAGEAYDYSANDISIADIDGDGEYELIVKWDSSNAHDVSIKGYTGNNYIDCYKLDGTLLWRIDMGVNIRAGAHYTQFMCYDFNNDGKAEISIKTAPGTSITHYKNNVETTRFITLLKEDMENGVTHDDDYRCSRESYYNHIVNVFENWHSHSQVQNGNWFKTLEECFGIAPKYNYPLSHADAKELTDYFMDVFAVNKSSRNKLREVEGFIYEGPEYLTMLSGEGVELQTIKFPFPREDDGLMWGDYSWTRIEPCNRVDRFLSGVAYLNGVTPSLVVCRGYYTRAAIAAYNFTNVHELLWVADSGYVPMNNPFNDTLKAANGTSETHGAIASQGNHSLSTADVDGDGFMEIIYGGATIDHDGTVLYSTADKMPDGRIVKLGHGDAMHVGKLDPDRAGLQIFNVFEGCEHVPYGYALRDGETGEVLFGQGATTDLGRCMVGDVCPDIRGMQFWVNNVGMWDSTGNLISTDTLGTNMSIKFAADLSTQITDGAEFCDGEEYWGMDGIGVINDYTHGVMLTPKDTMTNNGTKGNPCLVADMFGDFREEILLRTKDSSAIRIYSSTQLTKHKLHTLMHDTQYRCGIAWQNNCYNQPCYPSFCYGSDMSFAQVMPQLCRKPTVFLAGDSTMQSYKDEARPQGGWGEYLLYHLDENAQFNKNTSVFEQQQRYESAKYAIDNCAIAGRSCRCFIEEQRLADIENRIQEGDWLFVQFAHNDASVDRPQRYVPLSEYQSYLMKYINAARAKGATPVLISSIPVLTPKKACAETQHIAEQIPKYAKLMQQLAQEQNITFIDMNTIVSKMLEQNNINSSLYMPDFVHLTEKGANLFASEIAKVVKCLLNTQERWLYN